MEFFFAYLKPFNYSESNASETPRVRMIDDCKSIVLLRQRVQGEKLMRSSWELPKQKEKKNLSHNGESLIMSLVYKQIMPLRILL